MTLSGDSGVSVRRATLADLPAIVDIYNATIPSRMVTADVEPVSVESRVGWFEAHTPEKHPLEVAESAGRVVAWVSLQPFYGRPAYAGTAEISIYVREGMRRRGIGEGLLVHVMDACPSLAISTLLGFIFGHNEPSLRLFAKHGFHVWARLPRVAVLDGTERDLHIVGRRVEGAAAVR